VQQPERGPSRKVYTLTAQGAAELNTWLATTAPEPPHFRNTLLLQLAWGDQLPPEALDALLAQYEDEVQTQLLMVRERQQRGSISPARTWRETYLWRRIVDDWTGFYENELAWVRKTREGLRELESRSPAGRLSRR
jgi:PadR family transcriptional regulator AphA